MHKLRTLTKSDLPSLLAIENSVHILPWTLETFVSCLEAGHRGFVIEIEHDVVGFVIASITNEECHILNVCVKVDYQCQGFGCTLVSKALQDAKERGAGIAYLEVRRSNTKAIALYEKLKFKEIGVREAYYPGPHDQEDALIFAKSLVPFVDY